MCSRSLIISSWIILVHYPDHEIARCRGQAFGRKVCVTKSRKVRHAHEKSFSFLMPRPATYGNKKYKKEGRDLSNLSLTRHLFYLFAAVGKSRHDTTVRELRGHTEGAACMIRINAAIVFRGLNAGRTTGWRTDCFFYRPNFNYLQQHKVP